MVKVAALWRYPVKSFQGEAMERVSIAPGGVAGDRQYAVRDAATGKVLTAKRVGDLLFASARTEGDTVVLSLPDVPDMEAGDPRVDEALSSWLGRDVTLAHALDAAPDGSTGAGTNGVYEFTFDTEETPDSEYLDIPIPGGAFVDLSDAHLLTTASLAAVNAEHPDGDWDVRRFRPTALLDAGGDEGYVEDAWVGGSVRVGQARFSVELPTIRCVMPTRVQPAHGGRPALPRDKAVARSIADHHEGNLGVYCRVTEAGDIAVGDEVGFVTPSGAA